MRRPPPWGVERFRLEATGQVVNAGDIEEQLAIAGANFGSNVINRGSGCENVLDRRQGDNTLIGGTLGDTYVFDGAMTSTRSWESDAPEASAIDRVLFGRRWWAGARTCGFLREGTT